MENLHTQVFNTNKVGDICERIIIEIYTRVLEATSIAIDGGANTGWHTFGIANILTSGRVFAVEPVPDLLKILRERAAKYKDRVVVVAGGLSDQPGLADFTYFDGANPDRPEYPFWNAGLSSLSPHNKLMSMSHKILRIELVTIESILSTLPRRLDFIKLDLEGAEYHAIKGGERVIRETRPLIVFEDGGAAVGKLFNYGPNDLHDMLDRMDYRAYDILGDAYTRENWIKRDRWRPHYSIAAPNEFARMATVGEAVRAATQRFGIESHLS